MEDYYEILGIEKEADVQRIKHAYFSLLRKFPPERYPDKFKILRPAYETLSDEKKRAAYDKIQGLPEKAVELLTRAKEAQRLKKFGPAEELYKSLLIIFPEYDAIKLEYAKLLDVLGKSGKAVVLWEELSRKEPENAAYLTALGNAYDERSWHRKAVNAYIQALEFDIGNVDCWISLVKCYERIGEGNNAKRACFSAIDALAKHGKEDISLYAKAFELVMDGYEGSADEYIGRVIRLMKGGAPGAAKKHRDILLEIIDIIEICDMPRFISNIHEMADALPVIDDELAQTLSVMDRYVEIASLKDKGYPDNLYELLCIKNEEAGGDTTDNSVETLLLELYILSEFDAFKIHLIKLKQKFPILYALHSDFFNETLNTRSHRQMINKREKELNNLSHSDIDREILKKIFGAAAAENYSNEQQPASREDSKVGRNDPCPCGSGKKYKKCCGA